MKDGIHRHKFVLLVASYQNLNISYEKKKNKWQEKKKTYGKFEVPCRLWIEYTSCETHCSFLFRRLVGLEEKKRSCPRKKSKNWLCLLRCFSTNFKGKEWWGFWFLGSCFHFVFPFLSFFSQKKRKRRSWEKKRYLKKTNFTPFVLLCFFLCVWLFGDFFPN